MGITCDVEEGDGQEQNQQDQPAATTERDPGMRQVLTESVLEARPRHQTGSTATAASLLPQFPCPSHKPGVCWEHEIATIVEQSVINMNMKLPLL